MSTGGITPVSSGTSLNPLAGGAAAAVDSSAEDAALNAAGLPENPTIDDIINFGIVNNIVANTQTMTQQIKEAYEDQ